MWGWKLNQTFLNTTNCSIRNSLNNLHYPLRFPEEVQASSGELMGANDFRMPFVFLLFFSAGCFCAPFCPICSHALALSFPGRF